MQNQAPMTIVELAEQADVKVETLRRHLDILRREGAYMAEDQWMLPCGTRYPSFPKKSELKTSKRQYRAMLIATDKLKFVDSTTLGLREEEFDAMVESLVNEGYQVRTSSTNTYGLNTYACTTKASALPGEPRRKVLQVLSSLFDKGTAFVGLVIGARAAGIV